MKLNKSGVEYHSESETKLSHPKSFRWLIGLGLVLLSLVALKITLSDTRAASTTWEVNSSFSDESNCTAAIHQCKTIKAAVGAASSGDTISVVIGADVYDGFNVMTPNLTILGPNANFSPVTSSRFSEAQIISKVTIEASATGVTLQGFEFSRAEAWIQIKASDFTLKNNIFSGFNSKAIMADGPISNLAVENNLVQIAYLGIEAKHVTTGHITGNKINSTNSYIDNGIILDAVSNLQISENYLTNITNQAIKLSNSEGSSSNITISNNFIARANNVAAPDQGAIQIYGDNPNSLAPLKVSNNIIQNSRNGLVVDTGGSISGNISVSNNCFSGTIPTFFDLNHGGTGSLNAPNNFSSAIVPSNNGPVVVTPYLTDSAITAANNPSIEGDTINQSVILAQVKNSDGESVANQVVSYKFVGSAGQNPTEGVLTSDADGNIILTLSKGLSVGTYDVTLNPTSGNVSFPVNRPGCQGPIPVSLKVSRPCTVNSSGGAGYTSIEPALASSCSTIKVTGGGPYRESLTITRSVTLRGPNAGINPNTGVRLPETSIYLTDGLNDPTNVINRGVVLRILADNVVVDGFTIDGNNPSTDGGVSINGVDVNAAYGLTNYIPTGGMAGFSHVTVQNNIFQNFNQGAIRLDGISAAVSDNYILNNRLDNVLPASGQEGAGVYLGNNFYAEIGGNEMLRVRQGIKIKDFDAANPGTTAKLHNNTIDSFKVGIRYDNATGFNISDNTLTSTLPDNTNIGLWLTNIQAGSTVTLSNNLINGGDIGIKAWGVAAVTVSGGSITSANYGVYYHNYQADFVPVAPGFNSNLTLTGVTISDSIVAGIYVSDNTADSSNDLTMALEGNSKIKDGAAGITVAGQDTTIQLNDTAFSGQSGDYITLATSGGDGLLDKEIDGRSTKFEGIVGTSLTGDQYAALQAKLTDKNDNSTLGLVVVYNPTLTVSTMTLTYSDKLGGSNPAAQNITISNPTPSSPTLAWTLAAPDYGTGPTGWLTCGATLSGNLAAGASSSPISCQVTTGSLVGGTYSATFQVTSNTTGVQNSPRLVTVTFKVVAPPTITTDLADQTISSGQSVTLNVSATSLAPLSYQWYEGTDRDNSTAVGTDSPQFTSPALSGPTTYWVRVINLAGSTDSKFAGVTICAPFVVTNLSDTGLADTCGTFSYALKKASASTESVTISFTPQMGDITLTGALEPVTNPNNVSIIIDGGCNNQGVPGAKLLAGTNSGAIGLRLTNKIMVKCMVISGFSDFAVSLEGNDNQLESNWLGTLDGLTGSGKGGGVKIAGNNNKLGIENLASSGNHIFGNNNFGVEVASGQDNWAYSNVFTLVKNTSLTMPPKLGVVYVESGGQLKFGPGNRVQLTTVQS